MNNKLNLEDLMQIANPKLEKLRICNQQFLWKNYEMPQKLFGRFIYKKELTFLFGDSGSGKSNLAYYMANCICKGINGFDNEIFIYEPYEPTKVLYFDFELTYSQQRKRYDNTEFAQDFFIVNKEMFYSEYEELNESAIVSYINISDANFIIIDNLDAILEQSSQNQDEALRLMKMLNKLKAIYKIGILVITHTPKLEEGYKITSNSMAGSKRLTNLADNQFALGKIPNKPEQKYIKHLKARNDAEIYDVFVIEVSGADENNLHFEYVGTDDESNLIGAKFESKSKTDEIRDILLAGGDTGMSFADLKTALITNGAKSSAAEQRIQRAANDGKIHKTKEGLYLANEPDVF